MDFEHKQIVIKNKEDQAVEVEVWQGVGTGLAYHHPIDEHNQATGKGYAITIISLQGALTGLMMPTEPEVQAWLERVAQLDPDQWNIDMRTFKRRYLIPERKRHAILAKIELAHEAVLLPRDQLFLYAVDREDVPLLPSIDTDSEDPADASNQRWAEKLFDFFSEAVAVRLVRMDHKTGEHTRLHTYEHQASEVQS